MSEFYYQPRLDGFGHYEDNVYGGTMSQQEFIDAEFKLEDGLPDIELEIETPQIRVQCALGELALLHVNTHVYTFSEKWEHMNHVYHRRGKQIEPVYLFDMPQDLMDELFENEYRHTFSPYPLEMDIIAYHDYLRGSDPIERVTDRLLEKKEQDGGRET